MNTSITPEQQKAFRIRWAEIARNTETRKTLNGSAHFLRCLVLGISPSRQFMPVANPVKLCNGHHPWLGLQQAASGLQIWSMAGRVRMAGSLEQIRPLFEDILSNDELASLHRLGQEQVRVLEKGAARA